MRVMKPFTVDLDSTKLSYPLLASPKLDGIRAYVSNGIVYSSSGKPIRSKAVQSLFGKKEYEGFDGELIYGSVTNTNFQLTSSFVMSTEIPEGFSSNEIKFFVFDNFLVKKPFIDRLISLPLYARGQLTSLYHRLIQDQKELLDYSSFAEQAGYEGVVIRNPKSYYKNGRSTANEGGMGKIKSFVDSEAEIISFEEMYHNENDQEENELGLAKRSKDSFGLVPAGILGALVVRDLKTNLVFKVGSGFTKEQRELIWNNKESFKGQIITYKYFPKGIKELPRHPVFKFFRAKEDMTSY